MTQIITDANWRDHLDPRNGCLPRETPLGEIPGARVYSADDFPLVPEVEWPERIAEMTAKRLWPQDKYDDYNPVHKYQDGLNYCWIYSGAQAAEMTMACEGRQYIELAPESVGGAVNWRNAGYYVDEALVYWAEHGMATRASCPVHVISPSRFADDWEEDAEQCKPVEFIDCGMDREENFRKACSMLFTGKLVPWLGLNWWGHAITFGKLSIERGEVCPYTRNTHLREDDRILSGRQKYPDSLVCIREMSWRNQ